ncbi:hypothetical protein [Pseudomonas marginalis]|uniref:hypothetical protein n=1 Tax=Pseudomonas marginalis TaxID=298 RepID=UPI003B9DD511
MLSQYRLIKWMLGVLMLASLITFGTTCYSIRQNETAYAAFAERATHAAQERETQLAAKLDANIQRQIMGLRENFISWQVDQVAQTRKLAALEVAIQLRQAQLLNKELKQ